MKTLTKLAVILVAVLFLTSCAYISIKPTGELTQFKAFGGTVGGYMKAKNPQSVIKTIPYVEAALELSDLDLASADIIQTGYEFALKEYPNDVELIAMIKGGLDLLGLQFDISIAVPGEVEQYAVRIRAVLEGYLGAVD